TRTSRRDKCLVVDLGQILKPILCTGRKQSNHTAGFRRGPDARVGGADESMRNASQGQRTSRTGALQCRDLLQCPVENALGFGNVVLYIFSICPAVSLQSCFQLLALMSVMEILDCLFEPER